ncbi:MAG: hypothetical protein U0T33_05480 [Bacteroidales bacterium]
MKKEDIRNTNIFRTIRNLVCVILFLSTVLGAAGQTIVTEKPPLRERFFFGGNFAFLLGTASDVEILPVAGFWVLPRVAIAAGPGYRFYGYQKTYSSIYSVRGFIQLVPIRDIDRLIPLGFHSSLILQLEDEGLNLSSSYWHNVNKDPQRFWVNTVLAGAGLSQQLGKKASLNFVVLWQLVDPGYSIYGNPVIRIGIFF